MKLMILGTEYDLTSDDSVNKLMDRVAVNGPMGPNDKSMVIGALLGELLGQLQDDSNTVIKSKYMNVDLSALDCFSCVRLSFIEDQTILVRASEDHVDIQVDDMSMNLSKIDFSK